MATNVCFCGSPESFTVLWFITQSVLDQVRVHFTKFIVYFFYKVLTDHSLWSIRTPSKAVFTRVTVFMEKLEWIPYGEYSQRMGARLIHSLFSAYFVIKFQSVLQQWMLQLLPPVLLWTGGQFTPSWIWLVRGQHYLLWPTFHTEGHRHRELLLFPKADQLPGLLAAVPLHGLEQGVFLIKLIVPIPLLDLDLVLKVLLLTQRPLLT